ncbi:hypothetical protein SAMN05192574_101614 [Mucilaginibacter gossypiicola]|uniref:Uncharacterized protein n=1 Tax=Mucilaginibacter gossypiicola TaxID=551995 RepID=A0A1H8AQ76_9SPHI|nr:hypothetical protein SAMN05192574_101614 [Mucilaginibacter gossypiicola]
MHKAEDTGKGINTMVFLLASVVFYLALFI